MLAAPFPPRQEIVENGVGQVGGPPRGLQSSVLTALILTREILFDNPLLGVFAVCLLAAVIAWAKSRRRSVKAIPASDLKTQHGPIDDTPSRVTSASSGNDWHCARGLSSNPKSLTLPVESSETACTAPVTLETSTTTWKRSAAGSVSPHAGEEGIPTTTTTSAASIFISSITRAVSHPVTLAWSMFASMTTADLESRDEGRRLPLTDTNHGDEPKITSRTPEGRQEFSWMPEEGERIMCQKMWYCVSCDLLIPVLVEYKKKRLLISMKPQRSANVAWALTILQERLSAFVRTVLAPTATVLVGS